MIRRLSSREEKKVEEAVARGFDDYELRLGDLMRGERATMGKSLLDVERELRIKAAYIAAIENSDPGAFDTQGFIPGYVRSYARYLNMNPDDAFTQFCAESGFSTAHGMSAEASSIKSAPVAAPRRDKRGSDPLMTPATPFVPASEGLFSSVEPGAIGSALVLVALIGGIGYGGWSVLNEVQRVQFAPVENTPDVLSDLDPLEGAVERTEDVVAGADAGIFQAPADDRLDRLYRPQALDVPVLVARDAPISTLNPAEVGALRPDITETRNGGEFAGLSRGTHPAEIDPVEVDAPPSFAGVEPAVPSPQVVEAPTPGVRMVAVRPAWVRVRAANGSVIFEGILNAGDTYDVPTTQEAPTLRAGESGAIYFAVNGRHYGPVGDTGSVTSGLPLDAEMLMDALKVADLTSDQDLSRYVAELRTAAPAQE